MPATMYYDQDADLALLKGKTIAIIGYGSQGHAQAQNLRDSGCNVVVGQRPGSANYDLAVKHGFKPVSAAEAAEAGDLVNILLPDEVQGDIYARDIKPAPQARATCCSARTGSTSTSARSSRPRASTAPSSPPRARATSSAASSSRGAASPA